MRSVNYWEGPGRCQPVGIRFRSEPEEKVQKQVSGGSFVPRQPLVELVFTCFFFFFRTANCRHPDMELLANSQTLHGTIPYYRCRSIPLWHHPWPDRQSYGSPMELLAKWYASFAFCFGCPDVVLYRLKLALQRNMCTCGPGSPRVRMKTQQVVNSTSKVLHEKNATPGSSSDPKTSRNRCLSNRPL